jgi:hypothetical protein
MERGIYIQNRELLEFKDPKWREECIPKIERVARIQRPKMERGLLEFKDPKIERVTRIHRPKMERRIYTQNREGCLKSKTQNGEG